MIAGILHKHILMVIDQPLTFTPTCYCETIIFLQMPPSIFTSRHSLKNISSLLVYKVYEIPHGTTIILLFSSRPLSGDAGSQGLCFYCSQAVLLCPLFHHHHPHTLKLFQAQTSAEFGVPQSLNTVLVSFLHLYAIL